MPGASYLPLSCAGLASLGLPRENKLGTQKVTLPWNGLFLMSVTDTTLKMQRAVPVLLARVPSIPANDI